MPSLRRGLSLEHKLPLLITTLLVAVMAGIVGFAYAEVKRSSLDAARERLRLVAQQLASLSAPAIPARLAKVNAAAAEPAVAAYLSAPAPAGEAAARAALESLRVPEDAELPILLLTPDLRPVLALGALPGARGAPPGDRPLAAPELPDSSGIGRFTSIGGRPVFWLAVPVRSGSGARLGYLAELRSVGNPATARQVQTLIGEGVSVYYANSAGPPWIALNGSFVAAPRSWPFQGDGEYGRGRARGYLASATAIRGTPWSIVVEEHRRTIAARPTTFLQRSALAAALICLLGAVAAWLLSRSITRPVLALGRVTEAIAAGDYGRRLELDRSDELGALARRFNAMAGQVQASHEELSEQYEMAQSLAEELEQTNHQLEMAVAEAESAREDAEAANRTKSDFLATMSHEIRTPINAIVGYGELLQLGLAGPVTPGQSEQLERIRVSGQHLIRLVDQVLDFARMESGSLQLAARAELSARSVQTALTVVRPQAEARQVELVAECCEDGSAQRYLADPHRVEQILANLLTNAVKFTEPGGRVSVSCGNGATPRGRAGEEGRWTWVSVEDSGVGIPQDQVERVFEPFVQLESGYTRRHQGTGLGLAISLRLARSMGGEVTVESEPGQGSRFTLWLRAAPPEGATPASA